MDNNDITGDDRYKIYLEFIDSCRSNIVMDERHHILPKCCGGTNDEDNLIYLSSQNHYEAHKLLSNLFPENDDLQFAFWCTCTLNRHDKIIDPEDYKNAKLIRIDMLKHYSPWNKGKQLPEWMRKKISIGGKGLKRSEETRKRISKANKGKVLSEQTRKLISENHADVSGKNNPMYGVPSPATGTRFQWINNGLRNKRWNLDEEIPEGFFKGMIRVNKGGAL